METVYLLFFAALIIYCIARFLGPLPPKNPPGNTPTPENDQESKPAPYERKHTLLTLTEREFLRVLEELTPPEWRIFAQVRLADLVNVTMSQREKGYFQAFNRISAKHVDFVICDSTHLRIIGVIELDDWTHDREKAQQRDEVKNAALKAAGIPLLRVRIKPHYDTGEMKELLRNSFGWREAAVLQNT